MKKANTEYYGGFWLRFGSSFIDTVVVTGISAGMSFVMGLSKMPVYAFLFSLATNFIYFSLIQGHFQGSIGKHVMGLTLVDAQRFERISIAQSVGRYLMTMVSAICLFAGYFAVGFSDRKQGWHDRAAGTVVVKKTYLKKLKNEGSYEMGSNYTKAA